MTKTGGRDATIRAIPGDLALSVTKTNMRTPAGWRWVKLSDVARMESGHTPSRKHLEYWGGDIPWMSVGDARNYHGGVINDTEEHTNELGITKSSARLLPAGTVCLSRGGSVGYVVITGRPMATSQGFVNWICSKELDPKFLKYLFLAEQDSLDRFAIGATLKTIYYPEVKAFHICMPSIEEQRRIVAFLDEAFAAIATAIANARKNLANAREARRLLHRRAFEEIEGRRQLGDLASFRNGVNFTSSSRGEVVRIVGVKNFQDNAYVPHDELATVKVDGTLSEDDLLRADDILTVRSNGNKALIGRCMIATNVEERTTHSGFTIRIRPDALSITPEYLCRYLRSPEARERLIAGGAGTNISSLNQKVLASLPVPVPPVNDQQRIIDMLGEIDELSESLEVVTRSKLAHFNVLKQSLLHRAFSGGLTQRKALAA